jgi:hypothetical protein
MKCDSEKEIARFSGKLTSSDILEIEVQLRKCMTTWTRLNEILNKHLVAQKRDQNEVDDPTTTEENRKAWLRINKY